MQLINILGVALILASTAIAAPKSKNSGSLVEKRLRWESNDNSYDRSHQGGQHASWNNEDDYGGNNGHHSSKDKTTSWTNSLTSSISCATTTQTTVHVTTTISVTHTTTVTKHRTHHSHTAKQAATSSISTSTSSVAIPFRTGYSTGILSSPAPISMLYPNISRTGIPLSGAYSTGLSSSSRLTSILYSNSTTITVTPFTTHKSTHTQKHHSQYKATTVTVSSSMIFIGASSSVPTMGSSISKPITALPVTTTMYGTAAPTDTSLPHALLCGVRGFPVGDFFLGQLVESKPGVDITIQSCYEFCAGIYGIDMGCLSIEFYPELGTDAPRCNLYSEAVVESLGMIIPQVPNVWYDLNCGVPTS